MADRAVQDNGPDTAAQTRQVARLLAIWAVRAIQNTSPAAMTDPDDRGQQLSSDRTSSLERDAQDGSRERILEGIALTDFARREYLKSATGHPYGKG